MPNIIIATSHKEGLEELKGLSEKTHYKFFLINTITQIRDLSETEKKQVSAIILDVNLDPESSKKCIPFIQQNLPKHVLIFVREGLLEKSLQEEWAHAGVVLILPARLDHPLSVFNELEDRFNPKKRGFYDANLINSFIQATNNVMEYYVGQLPTMGKPYVKTGRSVASGFTTGVTSLTGLHVQGSASLTCEKDFMIFIGSRITGVSKKDLAQKQELIQSSMSDLCDQIFAKSGEYLEGSQETFKISLPRIFIGKDHAISHTGKSPVMHVPFTMKDSSFSIEFALDQIP